MNPPFLLHGLEVLFQWTWKTSLEASVLIALVFVIQLLLRRHLPARVCYLLSLLVLVRLFLPTVPASDLSLWNWVRPSAPPAQPVYESIAEAKPMPGLTASLESRESFIRPPTASRTVSAQLLMAAIWALGAGALFGAIFRQHRRFAKWVRGQMRVTDTAVLSLLDRCQAEMGVGRQMTLIATDSGSHPALFGWRNPCLLVSQKVLAELSPRELGMVFLHELAHVKRHDTVLNWLMILGRCLHWFNPLVWLAMSRLRADRELVCDAMVLEVLRREEHRQYGATLLKLLEGISAPSFCPSLVPVVNGQQQMKRRIVMIANFTRVGRAASVLAGAQQEFGGTEQGQPAPLTP